MDMKKIPVRSEYHKAGVYRPSMRCFRFLKRPAGIVFSFNKSLREFQTKLPRLSMASASGFFRPGPCALLQRPCCAMTADIQIVGNLVRAIFDGAVKVQYLRYA
jgi:hypothetical protein